MAKRRITELEDRVKRVEARQKCLIDGHQWDSCRTIEFLHSHINILGNTIEDRIRVHRWCTICRESQEEFFVMDKPFGGTGINKPELKELIMFIKKQRS